jgi:hypothetical protein
MCESRDVVVHEAEEWSAVYLDGALQRVGDTYLADEWIRDFFGVTTVQDDAFLRGQNHRDGVAQTLDELDAYRRLRDEAKTQVAALRAEADRLLTEARRLESADQ